jgi:hypothetical protein
MGFKTNGKGDLRIATCAVENCAKLWKAFAGGEGEGLANAYKGRGSGRIASRGGDGRQKGGSVENLREFRGESGLILELF